MLGKRIEDPQGIESDNGSVEGLGLLDIYTIFEGEKTTHQASAKIIANGGLIDGLTGEELIGYEIHMGQTRLDDSAPAFEIIERSGAGEGHFDGAIGHNGRILGTYLHGLFDNEGFRVSLLQNIKPEYNSKEIKGLPSKDEQYDKLAALVRQNLDMDRIYRICGLIE